MDEWKLADPCGLQSLNHVPLLEDSEDLVDAPLCSDSVTLEWVDRNGKPHAMGTSKLRELKSLMHSGMLRSIRVRL